MPAGRYRPCLLGLRGLAPPIGAVVLGEGAHKVVAKGGTVILEGEATSLDLPPGDYEIDGKDVTVK